MITSLRKKKGKGNEKGENWKKGKEKKEKGKEKDGVWLTQENKQNHFWGKNHIFIPKK